MHRYAFSETEFCQLKHLKEITVFSRSANVLLTSFLCYWHNTCSPSKCQARGRK